jgi:hypothetical protein
MQEDAMTADEQQSVLAEKLDNVTSRLILASRNKDSRMIKQCKNEAQRVLMDYGTFISDFEDDY